jgi:hypothetical protein
MIAMLLCHQFGCWGQVAPTWLEMVCKSLVLEQSLKRLLYIYITLVLGLAIQGPALHCTLVLGLAVEIYISPSHLLTAMPRFSGQ